MRWFRAAHHHLIGPNAAGSHAVADLTLLSVLLGRYTLAGLEVLHTVAAAASLLLPAFSCAGLLALATVAVPSLPPLLKPPLLPPPPTEGVNSALPLLHLADLRQPPLFWLHQMPEEVLGCAAESTLNPPQAWHRASGHRGLLLAHGGTFSHVRRYGARARVLSGTVDSQAAGAIHSARPPGQSPPGPVPMHVILAEGRVSAACLPARTRRNRRLPHWHVAVAEAMLPTCIHGSDHRCARQVQPTGRR